MAMEQMEYKKALGHCSDKLENVYDLAAFTYDYLGEIVEDQPLFVGEYIKANHEAALVNPNLEQLRSFSQRIEHILEKQEEWGTSFSECLELVRNSLEKITLSDYGNPVLNHAAIPFYVLMAVDRYVSGKAGKCTERAPLNHGYSKNSYVYLKAGSDMIDEAAEENRFSDMITASVIRETLSHLIILEKTELPDKVPPPRVVSLWFEEEEKKHIFADRKLRIAIIPFSELEMVKFPVDRGAVFRVEYVEKHLKDGIERALKLLDLAIDSGANIVVLPEFICYEGIQRAIQNRLKKIYQSNPCHLKNLLFVVAGSAWTIDNNNVAVIYSYNGRLLGRQYKYSRFTDLKREGEEMMENLQDPGRETTIIDIDGLGKVVIGICRDVSDRGYTKMLTQVYKPQLLLVPAWSTSVHIGFKEQFREITAHNHKTCSVLCNCCEALRKNSCFRENNGIISTPFKEGSVVIGKSTEIRRKEEKCRKCAEQGCVFLVNIYFDAKSVKEGRMIKKITCKF